MLESEELEDIIEKLTIELNETKVELQETKDILLKAQTNDSKSTSDWKRTSENLESEIESQKGEIEHLENTLSCFLDELTDLTPEMVIEAQKEARLREHTRIQKKIKILSAELEKYKNMWRNEEKRSEELEEALFQATMDEDDLRIKLEQLEAASIDDENRKGPALECIEEQLLSEKKAELESTANDVKEVQKELATKEMELLSTSEKLQQSRKKLKVTLDEKKFLELKASVKVSRLPNQKKPELVPTVVEDHRIPKNEPGRVRMRYLGAEPWRCPYIDTVEKLTQVLDNKNKRITALEDEHLHNITTLKQKLLNRHTQKSRALQQALNLKIKESTRLYNERLREMEVLSTENIKLRAEMSKYQGGWTKLRKLDGQPPKFRKEGNSKRSLVLKLNENGGPSEPSTFK